MMSTNNELSHEQRISLPLCFRGFYPLSYDLCGSGQSELLAEVNF
jgi:hypothetical protein